MIVTIVMICCMMMDNTFPIIIVIIFYLSVSYIRSSSALSVAIVTPTHKIKYVYIYSEDICLQTLTSFSITWIKITRACGWQKSFRAGQILCAQTNFQPDFRQVSILEFPSNFDSEAFL